MNIQDLGGCIAINCYAFIFKMKDFPLSCSFPPQYTKHYYKLQLLSKKMKAWFWASFTSRLDHKESLQKQSPRWNKSSHLPVHEACDSWLVLQYICAISFEPATHCFYHFLNLSTACKCFNSDLVFCTEKTKYPAFGSEKLYHVSLLLVLTLWNLNDWWMVYA